MNAISQSVGEEFSLKEQNAERDDRFKYSGTFWIFWGYITNVAKKFKFCERLTVKCSLSCVFQPRVPEHVAV